LLIHLFLTSSTIVAWTGDFDLIVEAVANSIDELQQLVMSKIRALEDVVRTHTVITVFTAKDELSYVP
jgi:DNA-binding Lrp family transcriptional regulator